MTLPGHLEKLKTGVDTQSPEKFVLGESPHLGFFNFAIKIILKRLSASMQEETWRPNKVHFSAIGLCLSCMRWYGIDTSLNVFVVIVNLRTYICKTFFPHFQWQRWRDSNLNHYKNWESAEWEPEKLGRKFGTCAFDQSTRGMLG